MSKAVLNGKRLTSIGGDVPTNGAAQTIEYTVPYIVTVAIRGTADILFHAWNVESVEAKAGAAKGSKAKKTDDVESYVYRDDDKNICVPGEYLRGAIIGAAKYKQDPRSPRKSAMDLFKAGIVPLTRLASLGTTEWDYLHKCRVCIQRNAVTRTRPAMREGWTAEFELLVNLPEYIVPALLHEVISSAGKLVGLGDFRPSYGRFAVDGFKVNVNEK